MLINKKYQTPVIYSTVKLELESSIMVASPTEALNLGGVDTAGQDVENYDFSNDNSFKHEWK